MKTYLYKLFVLSLVLICDNLFFGCPNIISKNLDIKMDSISPNDSIQYQIIEKDYFNAQLYGHGYEQQLTGLSIRALLGWLRNKLEIDYPAVVFNANTYEFHMPPMACLRIDPNDPNKEEKEERFKAKIIEERKEAESIRDEIPFTPVPYYNNLSQYLNGTDILILSQSEIIFNFELRIRLIALVPWADNTENAENQTFLRVIFDYVYSIAYDSRLCGELDQDVLNSFLSIEDWEDDFMPIGFLDDCYYKISDISYKGMDKIVHKRDFVPEKLTDIFYQIEN